MGPHWRQCNVGVVLLGPTNISSFDPAHMQKNIPDIYRVDTTIQTPIFVLKIDFNIPTRQRVAHHMWVCRVVCQWCPGQWGQGSWPEWPPSGQGQPAGQEASYWPPQGAPPSLGWFDVPQASGCWGPVGELGMRIGEQETVSTGCNAVTLWCHNTLGDFLKKWKPFSKQPRGFLCCSTHNGENQAWHIVLCATPSTISSESSRKNSLSGGLLGRLSVFNSCWILVDTLLLTGTPGQTPRAAAVTNICKQTMTRRHPHMQVYSNMNLCFNTHTLSRSHRQ